MMDDALYYSFAEDAMSRRLNVLIRVAAFSLLAASFGVLTRTSDAEAQYYCPSTVVVGCVSPHMCGWSSCNINCYLVGGSSCIAWGYNCASGFLNGCGFYYVYETCSCQHY